MPKHQTKKLKDFYKEVDKICVSNAKEVAKERMLDLNIKELWLLASIEDLTNKLELVQFKLKYCKNAKIKNKDQALDFMQWKGLNLSPKMAQQWGKI